MACLTPDNLIVSGGTLKIAAKKETVKCPSGAVRNYTSGFIGSRETGNYYPLEGRYEIRAKVPHAQGMWPAFWLRHRYGASTAEVDVMEYFHSAAPGRTSQTLHLAGQQNIAKTNDAFEAPTVSPGWHTWAVDIRKVEGNAIRFIFYTDGVETMRYVDYSAWKWNTADPNESWDMAVNMAVGGNWAGEPDGELGLLPNLNRCSTWGKFPPNCPTANIRRVDWNDPRTSTFEVDWVKHPS
jgi:beta-glucanase (GH16 family)